MNDTIDLLKVMLVGALLMAAGAICLFGLAHLAMNVGLSIDWIATFGALDPAGSAPLLADIRPLALFGSIFLAASGLALLVTSATLDMGLILLAKTIAVLTASYLGIIMGIWGYLRLAHGTQMPLEGLNRLVIVLVLAVLFAGVFSNASLRRAGWGRLALALGLIAAAPIVLSSL